MESFLARVSQFPPSCAQYHGNPVEEHFVPDGAHAMRTSDPLADWDWGRVHVSGEGRGFFFPMEVVLSHRRNRGYAWIRQHSKMAPRNFGGRPVASETFLTDAVTARSRHFGGEPSQMRKDQTLTRLLVPLQVLLCCCAARKAQAWVVELN